MRNQTPPLYVWGLVLLISCLFIIPLSTIELTDKRISGKKKWSYQRFKMRLSNFNKKFQVEDDAFVVFIIGSSCSAMAVNHNRYFHRRFFEEKGKKVYVYKLYKNGVDARSLEVISDFFSTALKLEPDLLCIEDRILAFQKSEKNFKKGPLWLNTFHRNLFKLRKNFFVQSSSYKTFKKVDGFEYFSKNHHKTIREKLAKGTFQEKEKRIRTFQENETYNHWLDTIKARNIKLVIHKVPQIIPVEEKVYGGKNEIPFRQIIEDYQNEYQIAFWDFEKEFPLELFSDPLHLNEKGMNVYSNWLFEKINDYLDK